MSTASRAYKKFYQDEKNGKHEQTYLLWEAIDTIVSGNLESEEHADVMNKEIEKRLTCIIDQGVTQARKEMAIVGISVFTVGISLYGIGKMVKKIAENKKLKEES